LCRTANLVSFQQQSANICLVRTNSALSSALNSVIMYRSFALATSLLAALARGQQVGTQQTETHPSMTWQTCTAAGKCTTNNGKVVIDANWRWLHDKTSGSYTNCYTGNTWNTTLCMYKHLLPFLNIIKTGWKEGARI